MRSCGPRALGLTLSCLVPPCWAGETDTRCPQGPPCTAASGTTCSPQSSSRRMATPSRTPSGLGVPSSSPPRRRSPRTVSLRCCLGGTLGCAGRPQPLTACPTPQPPAESAAAAALSTSCPPPAAACATRSAPTTGGGCAGTGVRPGCGSSSLLSALPRDLAQGAQVPRPLPAPLCPGREREPGSCRDRGCSRAPGRPLTVVLLQWPGAGRPSTCAARLLWAPWAVRWQR